MSQKSVGFDEYYYVTIDQSSYQPLRIPWTNNVRFCEVLECCGSKRVGTLKYLVVYLI